MNRVFKNMIITNIVVKDIDLYGCVVGINNKLSNDIVRKRLANYFIIVRKHDKNDEENVNGHWFVGGSISHWLGYLLHRDNDLPAVIHGELREDTNPADRFSDSWHFWYQHGKLHRDNDNPAIICGNTKEWHKNGKQHRDNDNPAMICGNDWKEWYKNGKLHRDNDKPAYIHGDIQKWYKNGELHRDNDKPAFIDGDMHKWYKNGEEYLPNL